MIKTICTLFILVWTTIVTLAMSVLANALINGGSLLFVGFGVTLYALCLSIVIVTVYGLLKLWRLP